MEQREFLKIIRVYRRRMQIADFLKKSVFALSIGAGVGILFQAVAFFVPFYYADFYMILAFLLAEVSVLVVMLVRRTTMEQAALKMDGFGFEERIVTAYENLDREGSLIGLQREDALKQLREHRDRIRISLFPSLKRTPLLLMLMALSVGISLLPSAAKDRAGELHGIKGEAKEKEEEIEEILEALEQLEQEELTQEQQEMLREMTESLESSLSEYQQAVSETMLTAASQKLDYKYENISSQMSDLIQELQSGAGVSVVSADSMMEMADRLKKMSEMRLARGDRNETGLRGSDGDGNGQGGQNGNGDGNGQGGQSGNGDGNSQNGQNGNGGGSGQGGQGGNGGGNGQGGQGGNGGGNGQSGQGGNGIGNGQNSQGQGGGSGNGRGDGGGSTPHDYISVPNAVADSGNLAGNAGNHETSEYFRAQNGLNWEGAHTSYEAVIGSYEQNAYEGIAAEKYPGGMEDIIKEYFASFN